MQTFRRSLAALCLLAALGLAGCKDLNETFTNNSGRTMTELRVWVKVKSGPQFPAVSGWYNNHRPQVTPQSSAPDSEGYYHYLLTWRVNVPPGGSIHVGLTFAQDQSIRLVHHGFWNPVANMAPVGGMSLQPRMDSQLGLVVDASNQSAAGSVTVSALQWTANAGYIPLENLDWTDPVLSLLAWMDATPDLPFTLAPGDVLTFDVPDGALAGKTHVLVRWDAIDEEGLLHQQPVFEMPVASLLAADPDDTEH